MTMTLRSLPATIGLVALMPAAGQLLGLNLLPAPHGDIFLSLETGPVLWRHPNGRPRRVLTQQVAGTGEGMAFDPQGNLYVARWCDDPACSNGNTVEKYNASGTSMGAVGSGYDCAPHTLVFTMAGTAYVGEGGCREAILKFPPGFGSPSAAFAAAPDNQGIFWLDLAPDGCTMFYTSYGPNVKRYDVCAGAQLPNLNTAPLPGGATQDLRVLSDGGVLVSSGDVVARLSADGQIRQLYSVPEGALFSGLDLVGDGTFWAANYYTSTVYQFDLASGSIRASFSTGTPANTVVGVRVKP